MTASCQESGDSMVMAPLEALCLLWYKESDSCLADCDDRKRSRNAYTESQKCWKALKYGPQQHYLRPLHETQRHEIRPSPRKFGSAIQLHMAPRLMAQQPSDMTRSLQICFFASLLFLGRIAYEWSDYILCFWTSYALTLQTSLQTKKTLTTLHNIDAAVTARMEL